MTRVNYRRLTTLHGVIMKYGLSDLTRGIHIYIIHTCIIYYIGLYHDIPIR